MTNDLINAARDAANAGRWDEAERLWGEVRQRDPENAMALFALGVHALQRGDLAAALPLAEAACAASPGDVLARLSLAKVHRSLSDSGGEGEAIQAALAIDPYDLAALLAKGAYLERIGAAASAAMYYRNAVKLAPPEAQWPAALREQLTRAKAVALHYAMGFNAFVADKAKTLLAELAPHEAARWREAVSIMTGLTRPYHAEGNQLLIPRLPALPFLERSQFTWAAALESRTELIRRELDAALAAEREQFRPYIAITPGAPVDQWRDLNQSARWSGYPLWRHGVEVSAHVERCPRTADALRAADMARIEAHSPNAMFSALAPHTQIPPHNGETNARVVAHLPLIVPENCLFRVGFEERRWRVGEVLVFDDTIEHEARNDSDELRVLLIFDVWNPLLSMAERALASAVFQAARQFQIGS